MRLLVPNLFTAVSAVVGFGSILLSLEGNFALASWFILWCVLLDKLDGTAARVLKASSEFGSEFDSMADLVAFGLAPSILVFCVGSNLLGLSPLDRIWWMLSLACTFYFLMTAVRLARFNTAEHTHSERTFIGIPTTLCGALISTSFLVAFKYRMPGPWLSSFVALLPVLGLGMVSRLPVPKIAQRKNPAFNGFQIANVVGVYLCGIAMIVPEYLMAVALVYLVVGTTHGLVRRPVSP
jgi:CDP-diacylglycerol---serine O-phosphatidyltransferase